LYSPNNQPKGRQRASESPAAKRDEGDTVAVANRVVLTGDYVVTSFDTPPLTNAGVAVEADRVVAVGDIATLKARFADAQVLGGAGMVVIPGLIDAHQHGRGVTNIQRGVGDGFLEQWLVRLRGLWPVDPYIAASMAAVRLLRTGVTTALHHLTSAGTMPLRDEMEACLRAYRDVGIRVTFTFDFRDRHTYVYQADDRFLSSLPVDLAASFRDRLPPRALPRPSASRDFVREIRNEWTSPTLKFALGPQGGDWSSDELLSEIVAFSREEGMPIHTHMLETRLQRLAGLKEHGVSEVERCRGIGLLSQSTSLAHMVCVDESDLDVVRDSGASIVHNPASNLRLRSGIAPVLAMLGKGIPVAIGMDGMSISDQSDFFQDLRLCAKLHFNVSGDAISTEQIWRMAYDGGSKATFWGDEIGCLRPGALADAVIVDLSSAILVRPIDPKWNLMERLLRESSPSAIRYVVVGGRVIIDEGKVQTLNEADLSRAVELQAEKADAVALADRRRLVEVLENKVVDFYRDATWHEGDEPRAIG
jgi:5-methylthioadenosine/S-adenosylhomocysteine deaminase